MPVTLATALPDATSGIAKLPAMGNEAETADLGLFAAVFQDLLGKSPKGTQDPIALLDQGNEENDADAATIAELGALLPFIEALGLSPTPATGATPPPDLPQVAETQAGTALSVITPPVVPTSSATPAISAAPTGATTVSLAAYRQETTVPLPPADTPATDTGTPATMATDLPAGREFSSQLTASLASREMPAAPTAPTATAALVHPVITPSVPSASATPSADSGIAPPVGTPGWTEAIGNRIAWMANHTESRAELVLNPPQMGRIEVSLSLKGDQATAQFVANNPVVRETLEAALPRLREVLADAGIQLGQTFVGADSQPQWLQQEKHGDNFASDRNRESTGLAAISGVSSGNLSIDASLKTGRGLVDVFA